MFVLPPWIAIVVSMSMYGFAFWKGDAEARVSVVFLLASWAATLILQDQSWPTVQWAVFAVDVVVFLFLLTIALKSKRYWPLAACGFQFLAVLTHLAKLLDPWVEQWAYITAGIIWTYLIMIALTVGAWNSWRERRETNRALRRVSVDAT